MSRCKSEILKVDRQLTCVPQEAELNTNECTKMRRIMPMFQPEAEHAGEVIARQAPGDSARLSPEGQQTHWIEGREGY